MAAGDVIMRDVIAHFHHRRECKCCTAGTRRRGVEAVEECHATAQGGVLAGWNRGMVGVGAGG